MKNQCPQHQNRSAIPLDMPRLTKSDPFGLNNYECSAEGCLFTFSDAASTAEPKDTNPKDAIGVKKLPLHLVPASGIALAALAFLEGALKYGKYNWRVAGVRNSVYLDAMMRHLHKYQNGQDVDPHTGVSHLASVIACAMIIIDAQICGKLNDDRPPRAPVDRYIDVLAEDVARLQELFKDHQPHQYTIEDGQEEVS